MKKIQILYPLLLIWLVLVGFQQQGVSFQETKSDFYYASVKIYEMVKNALMYYEQINTRAANEKKVRSKTPSGPSPVGNHRPPSKA
ncbi:hypothetical protein DH2020_006991 [Rehmannia glutinosa]|uniref:Secreted protein n=1 Tax=Rehmannia glutinosa TaxID=99300 RepID=A0ABR0W380_REHGL